MNKPSSEESTSRIKSPRGVWRTARVKGPSESAFGSDIAAAVDLIDFTVDDSRSIRSARLDIVASG